MSALLRSVRVLQTLKNVSGFAINSGAVKKPIFNSSVKFVGLRFLSVQSAHQTTREQYRYGVDDLLGRLDQEGRRKGRLSRGTVNEVHTMLCSQNSVNPTQALLLLRCYGSLLADLHPTTRTQLANDVWKKLETLGVSVDLSHYNTLLLVYLENEHDFNPVDFLAKLEQNGVQPNRVTYQRLIARYAQMGDIQGINKVLEFMKEKNLSINENIFHSLILGHARANDLGSAVETLELMRQSGLEPTMETYAVLCEAQGEKGDIDGINSTISLSVEKDQPLQDRHLLEVVFALAVHGHQQHVPQLLSSMKKGAGYNLDCVTVTLRLVTAGCDDVARQLYDTLVNMSETDSQSNLNHGIFFVKHLIASGRPLSTILNFCEDVSGSSTHLLLRGLETAVLDNSDLAFPLMDAIMAKGDRLRPHYFWPLLVHERNANNTHGIFKVMQHMKSRDVAITLSTMVDYVLPALLRDGGLSRGALMEKCKDFGLMPSELLRSMTKYDLLRNDIGTAAQTVSKYGFNLSSYLRRDLVRATMISHDYNSAAQLLSDMFQHGQQHREEAATTEDGDDDDLPAAQSDTSVQDVDVVGSFLKDLAARKPFDNKPVDFAAMLLALKSRGLSISRVSEAAIVRTLADRLTPQMQDTLSILASGTLQPAPRERSHFISKGISFSESSIRKQEDEVAKLREQGLDTRDGLQRLILMYIRSDQLEKAEEAFKTMTAEQKDTLGVGVRVLMMDLYYKTDQLHPALEMLAAINAQEPDAKIRPSKILKLAHMLVKEGRIDDAIAMMEAEGKKQGTETKEKDSGRDELPREDEFVSQLAGRILHAAAEKFDVATVERLASAIFDNNLAMRSSYKMLSAIIKAHLTHGDVDAAFDALMAARKEHNIMPFKNPVMKELIKKEDTTRLQRIIVEDTELRGEGSSMFDLALCFMEGGSIRQAKKVLEGSKLSVPQFRVDITFSRYLEQGNTKYMEDLLNVTSSLHGLDRVPFYCSLLQAYKKENDCDSALSLWTQMQEESLPISQEFLADLGNFLKSKDQEVPFTIPASAPRQYQPQQQQQQKNSQPFSLPKKVSDPVLVLFRNLLNEGKTDEALAQHHSILKLEDSHLETLQLVRQLLKEDRLADCVSVIKTEPRLQGNAFRKWRELRTLLANLASKGEMDLIKSLMDDSSTNITNVLGRSLCRAAGRVDRSEECFQLYHDYLAAAIGDEQKLNNLNLGFPKNGFLWLINKDESLIPKLEELSTKYQEQQLMPPQSTMWAYHFIKGNTEKMEQLKQTTFTEHEKIPHSALCDYMRDSRDLSVAPRLLDLLQSNPTLASPYATNIVYRCWIDILSEEKPKEALQVLESALKSTDISFMNKSQLMKLKSALAQEGVDFPNNIKGIPSKISSKSSSSSSSSDSDKDK